MERTLILIKPDGVSRKLVGEIICRMERKGFHIEEMKLMTLTQEICRKHYEEHEGKAFFPDLIHFMTSGPLVAMIVAGENAIQGMRMLIGCTNPLEATPGSIRGDYGIKTSENLVHGSDSVASAAREIQLFFPEKN